MKAIHPSSSHHSSGRRQRPRWRGGRQRPRWRGGTLPAPPHGHRSVGSAAGPFPASAAQLWQPTNEWPVPHYSGRQLPPHQQHRQRLPGGAGAGSDGGAARGKGAAQGDTFPQGAAVGCTHQGGKGCLQRLQPMLSTYLPRTLLHPHFLPHRCTSGRGWRRAQRCSGSSWGRCAARTSSSGAHTLWGLPPWASRAVCMRLSETTQPLVTAAIPPPHTPALAGAVPGRPTC